MQVISSRRPTLRPALRIRVGRAVRTSVSSVLTAFKTAWFIAFPIQPLNDPGGVPPTLAKAAALREGALLSVKTDAKSNQDVA
jgi:hypothetical protein